MQASEIFFKTPKGLSEIEDKAHALSLKERRVLILVNGENNTARLQQLSLCENIAEILDNLLRQGFIRPGQEQASAAAAAAPAAPAATATGAASDAATAADEIGARQFMCNTLLTFANRVRVAKLLEEIDSAGDIESLKAMVKPWYHAISETPGGMYQVDDLRKDLNAMIEQEEISGIR